jgi:hypothetical protein
MNEDFSSAEVVAGFEVFVMVDGQTIVPESDDGLFGSGWRLDATA